MKLKNLAVIKQSRKENERRLPIHPAHFETIPAKVRPFIKFEEGYGECFGVSDEALAQQFGGTDNREQLMSESDIVLLPKPLPQDLREMREGAILWGWPHCVQQREITDVAIERRLTLLAWEAMFTWKNDARDLHLFYRNNEMAGYCGVIHALSLAGLDGYYGPAQKAAVVSLGSVSRGAIFALRGRGIDDITVYTQRPPWSVHDQVVGCRYEQMVREDDDTVTVIEASGTRRPLNQALASADIIVNGILQDTDRPMMFLKEGEERFLKDGSLIVDVSADNGMGFPFARPTSFEQPTFQVGHTMYYAVDHTPTHLWRSASWEISRVVVPLLEAVMSETGNWENHSTLYRAIEICEGVIRNQKINTFQNRT